MTTEVIIPESLRNRFVIMASCDTAPKFTHYCFKNDHRNYRTFHLSEELRIWLSERRAIYSINPVLDSEKTLVYWYLTFEKKDDAVLFKLTWF